MKDVNTPANRRTLAPVCSIGGDDQTVTLRVEMPGVHRDDIEVRIDGDELWIRGRQAEESAGGTWLLRERPQGDYERRFTLDNSIDRNKIDAVYDQGVMALTLHLKDEVKPRRIEIAAP